MIQVLHAPVYIHDATFEPFADGFNWSLIGMYTFSSDETNKNNKIIVNVKDVV